MKINTYPPYEPSLELLYNSSKEVFESAQKFLEYYKRTDTDFIFDAKLGVYFVGMSGQHVEHMALLYRFHGGKEENNYRAADLFIYQNYGLFKSRAGHRISASTTFPLPAELRPLLRDIERLPCPIQL